MWSPWSWSAPATQPSSSFSFILPKVESILSVAVSVAASVVLFRSSLRDLTPGFVCEYASSRLTKLSRFLSSESTIIIEESDGICINQLFVSANVYLGSKSSRNCRRIRVHKADKDDEFTVSIDVNEEVVDMFHGVTMKWILTSISNHQSAKSRVGNNNGSQFFMHELRCLELTCHRKHRDMVLRSYLPYILQKAKAIREAEKTIKLHTVDYRGSNYWGSIKFDHPATFDTIAMDAQMKRELIRDLDDFVSGKEYYRKVGKAWKRGYLFYGEPGTGKSSLVGAIANYLKFDVYDLDLQEVQCDSDLRRLIVGTADHSILVIEDIDLSMEQSMREKITLAGLLNFVDGLWSCCGDGRIIVFTTNNKDNIEPVLLRPGRMDVHMYLSYCTSDGFETLALNYLQVHDHYLFKEVKELLGTVQATPSEVAGELMKSTNPDASLKGLVMFLQSKMQKNLLE